MLNCVALCLPFKKLYSFSYKIQRSPFFMLKANNTLFNANNVNKNALRWTHSSKSQTNNSSSKFKNDLAKECEKLLNQQISVELEAAFSYFSMACYFGRSELALPGCQGYFMNMYQEEHEHALMFSNYILRRCGCVILNNISLPKDNDWKCIANALQKSLELEQNVKEVQILN